MKIAFRTTTALLLFRRQQSMESQRTWRGPPISGFYVEKMPRLSNRVEKSPRSRLRLSAALCSRAVGESTARTGDLAPRVGTAPLPDPRPEYYSVSKLIGFSGSIGARGCDDAVDFGLPVRAPTRNFVWAASSEVVGPLPPSQLSLTTFSPTRSQVSRTRSFLAQWLIGDSEESLKAPLPPTLRLGID